MVLASARTTAPVAQRIEQRFPKPRAAGSSPAGGARSSPGNPGRMVQGSRRGGDGRVAAVLVSPRYEGPPIISIAGTPDDQLGPVTRQRRRLEAMIRDLSASDWTSASRCDDWTVQDVVA